MTSDTSCTPDRRVAAGRACVTHGPRVDGKFLAVDGQRFLVKGVTYGTFAPDAAGTQYPASAQVADDFAAMVREGFNTVRLYTPPRPDMMDVAESLGLKLIVGIPWA